MQEHRALGQPGGASRVLQERDVFVDHDAAGTQDAENAHGVLQTVRHHYRDPRALCEPLPLEPGAEGPRQALELPEADRPAHVGVGRAVAVFRGIALEQLSDRAVLMVVDLGRDPRRVVLEPDFLHPFPPRPRLLSGTWSTPPGPESAPPGVSG